MGRRRILMRRRNRHSIFFPPTFYFICSGPQSLVFFLCRLECLLRYLLLMRLGRQGDR